MKKTTLLMIVLSVMISITFSNCKKESSDNDNKPEPETGTFTDNRDGKTYKWVKIGDQIWMAENLAYKPADATGIWAYDNDEANAAIYGYLYEWQTAQSMAPDGWRLPTSSDLRQLADYCGSKEDGFKKLVESGTEHWSAPNPATNETGFSALPAGYFDDRYNEFRNMHDGTFILSSSSIENGQTVLELNHYSNTATVMGIPVNLKVSIRCVKK